jgi:hypothetical protein
MHNLPRRPTSSPNINLPLPTVGVTRVIFVFRGQHETNTPTPLLDPLFNRRLAHLTRLQTCMLLRLEDFRIKTAAIRLQGLLVGYHIISLTSPSSKRFLKLTRYRLPPHNRLAVLQIRLQICRRQPLRLLVVVARAPATHWSGPADFAAWAVCRR